MILTRIKEALRTPWKRTLYIIFFAEMMTSVGFSSIFPFLPQYVKALGSSTGMSIELLAALAYSGQAFTMMIASPIWGVLADRYGRKLMVLRAMFGGTITLGAMAFVRTGEELVLLRAIQGMITGTISAANALVAAETPRERVGYAMGMLHLGQAGGVALGPVIGGILADLIGYSGVFFFTAALILAAGLLVLFGIEERVMPQPKESHKRLWSHWKRLIESPGVIPTFSVRFTTRLAHLMILPMIPLFLSVLMPGEKFLNTWTGLVVGSAFITNAVASAYLGRLGDKIGHQRILAVSVIAAGLLYLPQGFVNAAWQLVIFQALFGIALGGMVPAISALLAKYTHLGQEGIAYGLDNSINSGARTIAPLLGAGVALWLGLPAVFIFSALTFFIAAFLAMRFLPKQEVVESADKTA